MAGLIALPSDETSAATIPARRAVHLGPGAREALRIGDQVTVTVLGIHGRQVRIGIAAPKTVAVHRQEIFERIQRERDKVACVAATPDDTEDPSDIA